MPYATKRNGKGQEPLMQSFSLGKPQPPLSAHPLAKTTEVSI
jgi:hypothetical protein